MTVRSKTNGIKSSEFWVTVIVSNIMLFANALGLEISQETVMSVTGIVVTYIGGRSYFKGKKAE